MNILVIGSGAREHAICRSIRQSEQVVKLYVYGSSLNPGIDGIVDGMTVGSMGDIKAMVSYAEDCHVSMAVIGPEAPLELGVVDLLKSQHIDCVGPTQSLAQIETSKGFARDLLQKHQVLNHFKYARFEQFDDQAQSFLESLGDEYVIKADGLMGGKGVLVSKEHLHSHAEAIAHMQALNQSFVIEQKLTGEEFSLISFSDGKTLKHMPAVQDHKRAYVGDVGPNTGGMGSYSDANHRLPFLTGLDIEQAKAMNEATVKALYDELGEPYVGILYGGFIKTAEGIGLIEYNARFGDPEAINLLPLLESDFVEICQRMVSGTLDDMDVQFKAKASVCKYVVPKGYPQASEQGPIDISAVSEQDNLYLGAVDQRGDTLMMTGSRAVAVLGVSDSILEAEQMAEHMIDEIKGNIFYRPDIGTAALVNKRIEHINALTGSVLERLDD